MQIKVARGEALTINKKTLKIKDMQWNYMFMPKIH
jgi:hypothetical protein